MITKNLLLIIDMQNDFCIPQGALYVPGAENDVTRLCHFIEKNNTVINEIVLTQDNHHIIDISHPSFWEDQNGKNPIPYTVITPEDINQKKWTPKYFADNATEYISKLTNQGEFAHVIWPEHCIIGSEGAALHIEIMKAISSWARKGRFFNVIQKGLNPLTEHFGAIRANIPINEDAQTQPSEFLIERLIAAENIIIAGEAKSHCVANTVKQILEVDNIKGQLIILEDAMSNVTGFEDLSVPIYEQAMKAGAVFTTTEELKLN